MSFYGSVYYQLIDTFYKVIVKNSGDKNYNFNEKLVNPSETPENDIVESPAVGRKGIFSLDSGNYWINFSKNESPKEAAPYTIWHSPAHDDPETMKRISSWDIETSGYVSTKDEYDAETGLYTVDDIDQKNNLLGTDHYIQLQEHDMLRLYESNYDEAGHIIPGQTKEILYRLPKATLSSDVGWLKTHVGTPSEGLEFPRKDGTESDITSIFDYAEKNYADIKLLEQYTGDWKNIADNYSNFKPTITSVIGDMDNIFKDTKNSSLKYYTYNKDYNLSTIIGSLIEVWKEMDDEYNGGTEFRKISLSDAIIKLKNITEDLKANIDENNKSMVTLTNGLSSQIGNNKNGRDNLYDEIENLYNLIDSEGKRLDTADTKIIEDYKEADNVLTKLVDDTNTAIRTDFSNDDKALDSKLTKLIEDTDTQNRNDASTAYTAIRSEFASVDAAIRSEMDEMKTDITKEYEAADNEVRLDFAEADQNLSNTINQRITELNDAHTRDINGINSNITNINNTINGESNNSSIMKRLDGHDTNIKTNTDNIEAIQNNIKNNIEVKFDNYVPTTIFTELDTRLTNNYRLKSDSYTINECDNKFYTKNDVYTKTECDDKFLVENNVNDLRTSVSTITGQITDITDRLTAIEGQNIATTLEQILKDIEDIKTNIENINEEINKLKPTEDPEEEV